MLSQSLAGRRAEIDYPCVWQYKVIGINCQALQAAVAEELGDNPYSLSASKKSGAGRYLSMNLEVTVNSDEQRQALYQSLAGHPAVKTVL
jgi:putative lipoic acid-binding regulatory protein